jgi:hypothetical protein
MQEFYEDAIGSVHSKVTIIAEHVEFRPVFINRAAKEEA